MASLSTDRRESTAGTQRDSKYWGSYVGFVRDTDDPERRGRVRFHCPAVMGNVDEPDSWLGWALPKMPLAGFDQGAFFVPPMPQDTQRDESDDSGSPLKQVAYWIEFQQGDPSYPIYTGGFWYAEGDIPLSTPLLADTDRGGDETLQAPTGSARVSTSKIVVDDETNTATTEADADVEEPVAGTQAAYPHNRLYKSPSGHVIEVDDTPQAERIKVYHRGGTYWEMNQSGSIITKVVGKNFSYVSEDDIKNVLGPSTEIYGNTRHVENKSQLHEIVRGERLTVVDKRDRYFNQAGFDRTVAGIYTLRAGQVSIESSSVLKLLAADAVNIGSQNVTMQGTQATIASATTEINSTSGVVLSGSLPATSATIPIYDSLTLNLTMLGALSTLTSTLSGPPNPATNAAGLLSFATALVTALGNSLTVHRVTKS